MLALRLVPMILSALALAAHFFRNGHLVWVASALGFPFLLLLRRRWAPRVVRAALVVGACEWGRTVVEIARLRQAAGEPWMRMAAILGGVALLALCAAALVPARRVRGAPRPESVP